MGVRLPLKKTHTHTHPGGRSVGGGRMGCAGGDAVPCHFCCWDSHNNNRAGTAVAVVVRWFFTLQSSFSCHLGLVLYNPFRV